MPPKLHRLGGPAWKRTREKTRQAIRQMAAELLDLAARRTVSPGEIIGVILTDGSSLKLKLGGMPAALKQIAGLRADVAGAARLQDSISERAIINLAAALNCKILQRWEALGKSGAAVIYTGLVMQGASA